MPSLFQAKKLGFFLVLVTCSQLARGDGECNAEACAEDPDFNLWAETVDTVVQTAKETRDGLYDEANEVAFSVKEKLDSQTCLDEIRGLDINAVLIDSAYSSLLNLQEMVLDLINEGCSMISDAANAKSEEFQSKINAVGDLVSEQTYGLAELGAEASDTQNLSLDYEIDDAALQDIVEDVNTDVNEKFFNGELSKEIEPFKLESSGEDKSGTLTETPTLDEAIGDAACWLDLGSNCGQE